MDFINVFLGIIITLICGYNYFLYVFYKKLSLLEISISSTFQKRLNLIPSLYDISNNYISKHHEVFEEILSLRKEILYSNNDFVSDIHLQGKIHHELNFIFTVIQKNKKIHLNGKYLLIKDLFIENSSTIGKQVILYKKMLQKYNFFLKGKKFTVLGLFFNLPEKKEI